MKKPKFRRTDGHNYSKLGVRRKKKQVYRKSKGRDNKIRLHMKGHVRKVKIGFRNAKKNRNLIKGKESIMIFNVEDLKKIKDGMIGVVGSIGDRKKMKIAEKVVKDKIPLLNLDAEKFLKYIEEKIKKAKEKKAERNKKKATKDKKAKEKEEKEKKEAEKKKEDEKKDKGKLEEKIEEKNDSEGDKDADDKNVEKIKKEKDDKNIEIKDKGERR
jgi:ribosomal protein L32E